MSKSILVAIDISQPAMDKPVLERAAQLAALDGARLDVITVLPNFGLSLVGSYFDDSFQDKAMKEAKSALNKFVAETLGDEANSDVRHIIASGSAYEKILDTAKKAETDLIVIGAHKPELSDYLLGPNAARVVRHSVCSVYVVR